MGSGPGKQTASRKKARQSARSTPSPFTTGRGTSSARPIVFTPSHTPTFRGRSSFLGPPQNFSLDQEAQNTQRASPWSSSSRLRNSSIKFVSGGKLHQDQLDEDSKVRTTEVDILPQSSEEALETPSTEQNEVDDASHLQPEEKIVDICSAGLEVSITDQVKQIDLSTTQGNPEPGRPRSNTTASESSSDVVLFAGRGKPPREPRRSLRPRLRSRPTTPDMPSLVPMDTDVEFLGTTTPSRLKPDAKEFVPLEPSSCDAESLRVRPSAWTLQADSAGPTKNHSRRVPRRRRFRNDDDEETAILQDYIENVKANQEVDDGGLREDRGASETSEGPSSQLKAFVSDKKSHLEWTSDDLRDFDELETSDDENTNIGSIFSCRTRRTGLQYLVTPAGQSIDDAKWIPRARLTSTAAKELILAFEKGRAGDSADNENGYGQLHESEWDESSDHDSDGKTFKDLVRNQDAEQAENEQLLQRASAMTDTELARILNKQAELGYGTDEVALFNGDDGIDEGFIPFSAKTHGSNRIRSKRNRRARGAFPSAEAFADVLDEDPYHGFDVMDFDRPSLKPKKKGRRSANGLPFELEDEGLAEQIAQSWAVDRAKKAARKVEREKLRQAGLLGSDAHAGYWQCGMDMDQVKAEVRAFLMDNDREVLTLVPMQNGQRAQVHVLAKALRLASVSHGKGENRYPVLTKTDFSGSYNEDTIDQIDALLAKRKFCNTWGKRGNKSVGKMGEGGGGQGRKGRGGGGGVAAGATYMDGEVVGAAAPELGSENKGRAMLEKMGWSTGMGIGKEGNQGSVEAIKHVVKNSKAGLG